MSVQNWRWWQWLVASVVVGGVVGFALTRLDTDDQSVPTVSWPLMRAKIERRTETGESVVTRIRVAPAKPDGNDKPVQAVTFWERQKNRTTGSWDLTRQFRVYTPVPLSAASPRPDFGVVDYLAERKKAIPTLDYRFSWWLIPRNLWLISLGGSVLLIGVVWPQVMRALVAVGLGAPPDEAGDDLSAVRSTSSAPTLAKATGVTAADRDQLAALNAELAANVGGLAMTPEAVAADAEAERPAGPAPVRVLNDAPAAPVAPAATPTSDPNDFKGEFYPVARPVLKKD